MRLNEAEFESIVDSLERLQKDVFLESVEVGLFE